MYVLAAALMNFNGHGMGVMYFILLLSYYSATREEIIIKSCNRAFSVIQSSQKALQVEEIKVLHKLFSVSEGIPERPKKFQVIFFFFCLYNLGALENAGENVLSIKLVKTFIIYYNSFYYLQ